MSSGAGSAVAVLPAGETNYIFVVTGPSGCVAVDPGEAAPVRAWLAAQPTPLRQVLLTHHHGDHTGGAVELARATGAALVGPADPRMPRLDRTVAAGTAVETAAGRFDVLGTPGHTASHIAYRRGDCLFAGDCLFGGGCGRLFDGTAAQQFDSLCALAALPPETRVYCGHEYTLDNLEFAQTVDGDNVRLRERLVRVRAARAAGRPTVPFSLAEECGTNPFLRVGTLAIRRALALPDAPDVEVFAALRRRKDAWQAP